MYALLRAIVQVLVYARAPGPCMPWVCPLTRYHMVPDGGHKAVTAAKEAEKKKSFATSWLFVSVSGHRPAMTWCPAGGW
eukprot:COSAG06_NODE_5722_length_3306_cov_1.883692_5_plen_79_part_00